MSTFTAFERVKLSRFINVYGNSFTFRRKSLNDCGEPKNESSIVCIIDGVFRETTSGYTSNTISNGTRYVTDTKPMILCLQDERSALLMPDDYVEISDKVYKIIRLNNVGKFGYAWDISLELIEDGGYV